MAWLRRLGYSESSLRSRGRQLGHFLMWLDGYEVDEVDQKKVKAYAKYLHEKTSERTGLGLSGRTIEAYLSVLILLDKYRIKHSQAALLRARPQVQGTLKSKARRFLSRQQITQLYAAVPADRQGPYLRCLLALFYGCGLRCGEGIRLKVQEVDLAGGLLLNRWGGPANNSGLNKQLAALCELAGVEKVSLHGLRHSIATHLLQDGMPLPAIGRFLGHRSLKATQTYTHLVDEL